jgi:RHS repeat-associated protein
LQRISTANYSDINDAGTVTASNRYNTSYTYADLRGNISNNQRNGLYLNGSCYTEALLDNMTYTYTSGSNKISSILDAANITQGGFRASSGAFTYDNNGNQISNAAKGITSITYNHLNLPSNITLSGSRTIDFTYTADGTKLRKVVKTGATINLVQEYVNGIEYRGTAIPATTIEGIYHAEGRLLNNAGTWKREYVIKDHLGDTRLAYCDINNDGVIATPSEILQENNYDAFGYGLDGVYMNHANQDNLYQYNGKEKNDDHGIGLIDYGARFLDQSISRWLSVDPLGENNESNTPFQYASNNPILMIDPDGLDDIYYDGRGNELRRIINKKDDRYFSATLNKDKTITVTNELPFAPEQSKNITFLTIFKASLGMETGTSIDKYLEVMPMPGNLGVMKEINVLPKIFKSKFLDDFSSAITRNQSALFSSEREARNFARTKIGKNPIKFALNKWRSQDGKWQYRGKSTDISDNHIHLEELNPNTGEVIQNLHLRWK